MKIFLVTTNTGKLKEIGRKLEGAGISLEILEKDFVEVQADSLEEVVHYGLKELNRSHEPSLWLMKDDSGLFIEALDGFPGVYSSFVHRTISNNGILRLMEGRNNRRAVFRTVVGLYSPEDGGITLFKGECSGAISGEERGRQGFGYDPIFIPDGSEMTFAEMSVDEKNSMSHRSKAVGRMADYINRNR